MNKFLGPKDEMRYDLDFFPTYLYDDNIWNGVEYIFNRDVFYYFFTPYSVAYWREQVQSGSFYRQIEAERLVIEEILKCDNVELYSVNNRTDITTDLDNYKYSLHYGEWINSLMLRWVWNVSVVYKGKLTTSVRYRNI